MSRFAQARLRAAFGLLVLGSVALVGADVVHPVQPVATTLAGTPVTTVNATVTTSQFEDLVQPTAAPTIVPTVASTILPTVAPTTPPTVPPTAPPTPRPSPTPAPKPFETGIASTYGEGDGFEGNRTACGQIFHTRIVQIAHKSLPCGTRVRVVDTSTGNSVEARVTDRGPYVAGRIVDLSWGAFQQLDPTGPGLLHVEVFVLDD